MLHLLMEGLCQLRSNFHTLLHRLRNVKIMVQIWCMLHYPTHTSDIHVYLCTAAHMLPRGCLVSLPQKGKDFEQILGCVWGREGGVWGD